VVSLRVIGAGLPRTGTRSLKAALEVLLGQPCYHMEDVFSNLDHVPVWRRALAGEPPDWTSFPPGCAAAVDWPTSAFWPELSRANPDALVVLSTRTAPRTWWRGADRTILPGIRRQPPPELAEWHAMVLTLIRDRFTPDWEDEQAANDAYDRHNDAVRAVAPPGRLLDWQAVQGWEPLCEALDLAVPDQPFPHFAGVHSLVDSSQL
jgi:hypothetical protein